jgi:SAM-dependent MidA family methyltransferase
VTLTERLAKEAKRPPGIRFDRFMGLALYDPDDGYYATSAARAGPKGDFVTAPELSPIFAECLSVFLDRPLEGSGPYRLLEVGAGAGTLAKAMRKAMEGSRHARDLVHHLVERGGASRAKLEKVFAEPIEHGVVVVHGTLDDLPSTLERGAFVANELFDNLPVRRVMQTDRLMEILVRWRRGRFEESLVDAPEELVRYFEDQSVRLRSGQTAEVCLEAPALLGSAIDRFAAGCDVVLVDYGDEAERLYAADAFPNGTLACHRRHGTDRAFYEDVGRKDITAHVNFTMLRRTLEERGFEVPPLKTQAEFLLENDFAKRMVESQERTRDPFERVQQALRAKQLFHPEAMGEAFRVLVGRRG